MRCLKERVVLACRLSERQIAGLPHDRDDALGLWFALKDHLADAAEFGTGPIDL